MKSHNLGLLEKVELRNIWESEAVDFTPWLAQERNLKLLGDTIGIDLELEAQEKDVGPFRADILCKDTASDTWVLIENQLEKTDHKHLGQLLTYAAGLKAVTIVWIAERLQDEHRAALDWLNNITDDDFTFIGLEVELWKIADSPVAPKFNVVSKPNDWSRSIKGNVSDAGSDLTATKQLQLEFWTGLREFLRDGKSHLKPQNPRPRQWFTFAVGRSKFGMHSTVNTLERQVCVNLLMTGRDADAHLSLLQNKRTAIESELGFKPEWKEHPGRKRCSIVICRPDSDISRREQWPEYFEWLRDKLEAFHKVFSERIKHLDAQEFYEDKDVNHSDKE